ncbi:hypothetical protein LG296_02825 [Ureibacillus chungkukjangi]
MRLRFLALNQ